MSGRTPQQNKALHVYFELLANSLNDAGLDMREVLKPEVDIPWSKETVKEHIWRPIMDKMSFKLSTTELDTDEVSKIYDVIDRHTSQKFGIHVPFPEHEISYPQD